MDKVLLPSGRWTTRIGFGCGRLFGGASARQSERLLETARALGICHFDVAPSYGLGLAENVLGNLLGQDREVTVATKIGIARPANPGALSFARRILKPLVGTMPSVKNTFLRYASSRTPRGRFTPQDVQISVSDSLNRLKRERVDILLLHEASSEAITPELDEAMSTVLHEGLADAIGSGTDGNAGVLVPFGTVYQHRWQPAGLSTAAPGVTHILHGTLRHHAAAAQRLVYTHQSEVRSLGFDPADPASPVGLLLTFALASAPGSILLVSSNDTKRLSSAIGAIDWPAARGERPEFSATATALLRQEV